MKLAMMFWLKSLTGSFLLQTGEPTRVEPSPSCYRHAPGDSNYAKNPLKNFLVTTSAHGYYKVYIARSPSDRFAWIGIIILVTGGFVAHLGINVIRFLDKPVYSEVFASETGGFLFPQVTMCFENPLANRNVRPNITNPMHRGYTLWPKDVEGRRHAELMMFHYFYEHNFSIPFGGLMWSCKREKTDCSMRDFRSHWDPHYGLCFMYAPEQRLLHMRGREDGLILGITSGRMLATSQELLMTEYTDIFYQRSIFISIDDMETFPDMGYAYSLKGSTRLFAEILRRSKHSLNRPQRPCRAEADFAQIRDPLGRQRRYVGSRHLCLAQQQQQFVMEQCRCFSEAFPLHQKLFNASLPWCHRMRPDMMAQFLSKKVTAQLEQEIQRVKSRAKCEERARKGFEAREGSCNSTCRSVMYKATFINTHMDRFSESSEKYLLKLHKEMQQRLAAANVSDLQPVQTSDDVFTSELNFNVKILNFFASSLETEEVVEDFVFPLESFASQFGGMLGFWIGVSIISVIEVFEMMLKYVALTWKKTTSRDTIGH